MDSPELLSRIAKTFSSRADVRFAILLWGEKSCLDSAVVKKVPIYNYEEIIDIGQESRRILLDSHDASKCDQSVKKLRFISTQASRKNMKILFVVFVLHITVC